MNERLVSRFRSLSVEWRQSSPGFSPAPILDSRLPPEYVDFIRQVGPGEGFVGTQFFRLYPLEQLASANVAYAIELYLPDHLVFGSDGCGNALLFDPDKAVLVQPFIPLDPGFTTARYPNWSSLLEASLDVAPDFQPLRANPKTYGLELHERHPIVLGGDPTDPANRMLLPPPTHAEACVFFNKIVKAVRAKQ